MCGISGVTKGSPQIIKKMNDSLVHRGPDASSEYIDENVSLGHRLLSIRGESVATSTQPFLSMDKNWVLVFNGEIYNTHEICRQNGFPEIDLDTEVLMRLIELKGWSFVEDIQGMFAIALYNKAERKMRLYRDITGQKGIYYFVQDDTLFFASEIKSLLPFMREKTTSKRGLELALAFGYIPAPFTLFQNLQKMQPGEFLEWDFVKNNLISKFFTSSVSPVKENSEDFLSKSIQLHALSHKKVGVNLSGGLDSSIVFYELVKNGIKCDAYTTVFETKNPSIYNEEAEIARKLAKDFGMEHHDVSITKRKYLDNFIEAFETVEEPNHNIGLPHYLALAKEQGIKGDQIRVLLAGDGGDEVFAGYEYYFQNAERIKNTSLLSKLIKNPIYKIRNKTNLDYYSATDSWLHAKSFRNSFNKVHLNNAYGSLKQSFDSLKYQYEGKQSDIYNLMLMDRKVWLASENFVRTDKIFMSQSIEIRSPFAYYPIRKHFDHLLNDKDYGSAKMNKLFLRKMYQDRLPSYVVNRERKWGWKPPWGEWFDNDVKDFLAEVMGGFRNNEMIEWESIRLHILKSDQWPGREFWSYVSLAILKRKYGIDI